MRTVWRNQTDAEFALTILRMSDTVFLQVSGTISREAATRENAALFDGYIARRHAVLSRVRTLFGSVPEDTTLEFDRSRMLMIGLSIADLPDSPPP